MKKWFIIEGNIGSGKTTLINKLKNNSNFEVFEEPVEVWRNIKGSNEQNLLGLFYEDPVRYSYLFQTIVFKTRLQSLDIIQQKNIRFSERSIWSDKYVFGKSCIENNKMNELEKNCYYQWFDWLEEKFNPIASGIIYVKTSPELCLERIQQRARGEENTIPLSYLKELDDRHNLWLDNWTSTPVLIIDNNNNIDNINHWNNILDQINNFIL
jgi:deoxyadenosine/deoxycytidine kinase